MGLQAGQVGFGGIPGSMGPVRPPTTNAATFSKFTVDGISTVLSGIQTVMTLNGHFSVGGFVGVRPAWVVCTETPNDLIGGLPFLSITMDGKKLTVGQLQKLKKDLQAHINLLNESKLASLAKSAEMTASARFMNDINRSLTRFSTR